MMMTRKSRRGIFILVVLTMVSFWLGREHREEKQSTVSGLDPSLDYMLQNFSLRMYDATGQPLLNMHAPLLRNNPGMKLGTIENPVIALERPDAHWSLVAERATMTADRQHIHLIGDVNVQRFETATGNHAQLNTPEIQVEVAAQTANTAEPVSLTDGRNHMQALGMDLDMKSGRFKLRKDVKASYAVD